MTKVVLKSVSPAPRVTLALSPCCSPRPLLTTPAAHPRQFNTRGKAWGRLVWNGRPFATRDGDLTGSGRIRCSRKREWQWLPGSWRQRNAEAAEAAAGAAEAAAPSSAAEATAR